MEELPINEIKKAVALKYDGSSAPQLIAKGDYEIAKEIIEIAEQNQIPLCDNAALVDLLSRLDLGEEIPEALYLSVAHILAFAYALSGDIEPA